MEKVDNVDQYIMKHEKFREILNVLRSVALECNLTETIKWSSPTYTFQGKNIIGLAAFKNHAGIWFFQGALLKDQHKLLTNAQEGKTKALRQIRFNSLDDLKPDIIKAYILEAIENQKKGLEIKPTKRTGKIEIPQDLLLRFKEDAILNNAFKQLTPGKQREYVEHISSAKREATKIGRIEKIIPLIKAHKGLYDKYKNC